MRQRTWNRSLLGPALAALIGLSTPVAAQDDTDEDLYQKPGVFLTAMAVYGIPAPQRQLEHDVERLLMITEAMWGFLKEQHGFSDEKLIQRVMEIDLEDGRLDGRVKKTAPMQCSSCERAVARRHVKCIYCGTPIVRDPFDR